MNRRRLIKSAASAALLPSLALPVFSAASVDGTTVRPPVPRVRPGDPAWPSAASWDQLTDLDPAHELGGFCMTPSSGKDAGRYRHLSRRSQSGPVRSGCMSTMN